MHDVITITDEQVALAMKLWIEGEPETTVALAIGVRISTFRRLRRGQLKGLGRRTHGDRDSGRRSADPSPEEIAERAAEVRRSWCMVEALRRTSNIVGNDSKVVKVSDIRAAIRHR